MHVVVWAMQLCLPYEIGHDENVVDVVGNFRRAEHVLTREFPYEEVSCSADAFALAVIQHCHSLKACHKLHCLVANLVGVEAQHFEHCEQGGVELAGHLQLSSWEVL